MLALLTKNFLNDNPLKMPTVAAMPSPIQREFDYYLENQEAIALRYQGRFVVIKNCEVIADYSTDFEAVTETSKKHPLGSFLVQKAEAGEDDVAQIFHSRVSFC